VAVHSDVLVFMCRYGFNQLPTADLQRRQIIRSDATVPCEYDDGKSLFLHSEQYNE